MYKILTLLVLLSPQARGVEQNNIETYIKELQQQGHSYRVTQDGTVQNIPHDAAQKGIDGPCNPGKVDFQALHDRVKEYCSENNTDTFFRIDLQPNGTATLQITSSTQKEDIEKITAQPGWMRAQINPVSGSFGVLYCSQDEQVYCANYQKVNRVTDSNVT